MHLHTNTAGFLSISFSKIKPKVRLFSFHHQWYEHERHWLYYCLFPSSHSTFIYLKQEKKTVAV